MKLSDSGIRCERAFRASEHWPSRHQQSKAYESFLSISQPPLRVLSDCVAVSLASTGILTINALPSPILLSTVIAPPCRSTIPYEIDKPNPVPTPTAFVVKNGS